jgi:hypothetical protein
VAGGPRGWNLEASGRVDFPHVCVATRPILAMERASRFAREQESAGNTGADVVAAAEGSGVRGRRPVPELQVSGVTRPWEAGAAKACRRTRSPGPGPAPGGVRGRGDAGAVTRPPWAAAADLFGREKNSKNRAAEQGNGPELQIAGAATRALFSWAKSGPAELLYSTVVHCSILFLFGTNCPNVD